VEFDLVARVKFVPSTSINCVVKPHISLLTLYKSFFYTLPTDLDRFERQKSIRGGMDVAERFTSSARIFASLLDGIMTFI
jgi:hypothetical protein